MALDEAEQKRQRAEYAREWRRRNRDRVNAAVRAKPVDLAKKVERAAYHKAWCEKNREYVRATKRADYARVNAQRRAKRAADPEYNARLNAESRAAHYRNREERLAKQRVYRAANIESLREKGRLASAKYRAEHRDLCLQRQKPHWRKNKAKRKAALDHRTPAWADLDAIAFFYECAPAGCHVDHIIPLRGRKVSGLHVAENLQWLPDAVNLRKGNAFAVGLH